MDLRISMFTQLPLQPTCGIAGAETGAGGRVGAATGLGAGAGACEGGSEY